MSSKVSVDNCANDETEFLRHEVVAIDEAADRWGLKFHFKCLTCGTEYFVIKETKEDCDAMVAYLNSENHVGEISSDTRCPKYNLRIVNIN